MAMLSKFEGTSSGKTTFLKVLFSISSAKSFLFLLYLYKKSTRKCAKVAAIVEAQNKRIAATPASSDGAPSKKRGGGVNKRFVAQLRKILRILIPSWRTPEVGYMGLVSVLLVIRAFCDLWTIYLGTLIESSIISGEPLRFNELIKEFAMTMPTMALTNAGLKYSIRQLEIRFRSRLTRHLMTKYVNGLTFYKLNQTERNVDQLITTDVEKFTSTLATLYSRMSKPLLDMVIYVYGISTSIGASVPRTMMMYLAVIAAVIARLRRPMATLTATEQSLEGEFRFGNSRLITNAEEIAFYKGGNRELLWLLDGFGNLYSHLDAFTGIKFIMEFVENVIAKYAATIVGYYAVSRPFFRETATGVLATSTSHKQRQEVYYKSGRMLLNLALAMGRFILNTKDLTRLAGYTSRVSHLMDQLDDINAKEHAESSEASSSTRRGRGSQNGIASGGVVGRYVLQDNIIRFDQVPIVTPSGDVLVKELSIKVKSGMNVLVCGPNGCGKSSLFRILGELWPLQGGVLTKPARDNLFYVPQKPYMPYGTFRDQIIYPDTKADMQRKGRLDKDLIKFLKMVDLEDLLVNVDDKSTLTRNKPNGELQKKAKKVKSGYQEEESTYRGSRFEMDAVENWMDVLSGGQKQRMAMARMFYHSPQFAILDECTSAVSVDVEGSIYKYCRDVGITLFTVSHRKSLWAYHDYVLEMDGRGEYRFEVIELDKRDAFGS